jgi:hypothetical protein
VIGKGLACFVVAEAVLVAEAQARKWQVEKGQEGLM